MADSVPSVPTPPSAATPNAAVRCGASVSPPAPAGAPSVPFPSDVSAATGPSSVNTFLPVDVDDHGGAKDTKIILLSGFSDKELHAVIDAYRLNKALPKAIFATVTEQSENFKVKDLLAELTLEKEQIEAAARKGGKP